MVWTSFCTDFIKHVKNNCSVEHNPIFIEASKIEAVAFFGQCYGENIVDFGKYIVIESPTLEEATAFYRGCIIKEYGFVEQSRGDKKIWYYSINNYLALPNVLVIKEDKTYKADGEQCFRCKDFILWAEPNSETGKFFCRACRLNPYR